MDIDQLPLLTIAAFILALLGRLILRAGLKNVDGPPGAIHVDAACLVILGAGLYLAGIFTTVATFVSTIILKAGH